MKTLLKFCMLICLNLSFKQIVHAQSNGEITGIAVDSTTLAPIPFTTVKLTDQKGLVIKTIVASDKGEFKFAAIQAAQLTLHLSALGYITKEIAITVDKDGLKLEKILLQPQTGNIKEVEILANKKIVTADIDKLTYDLDADPEAKATDALNIMRKIPYLTVDGNDQILLKGQSDFKILVNGRPSSMMERDAKNILKNMPASNISKIEVITNPSAKYDADGVGGIINIVTTKKIFDGYSGSISSSERFPVGGPSLGGYLTTKTNKIGIHLNANAYYNNSPSSNNYNSLIGINNKNALSQNGIATSNNNGGYLGGELSYEIDSLQLISGSLNLNKNRGNSNMSQSSIMENNMTILEQYNLENEGKNNGSGNDFSINYQLGFKKHKDQILTFSYRGYSNNNDFASSQLISNKINYTNPDFNQNNESYMTEQTAQVDYIQPYKKLSIEGGIKAINRFNKGNFQYNYLDAILGNYVNDPLRSNLYTNEQWIFGAYNSYSLKLSKVSFRLGFRVEKTVVDAAFQSNNTQVRQDYWSFLPNVSFRTNISSNKSLNLSFTQRINRPGINRLNPFVDRSNPNFETAGNPNLKSAKINNLNLEYSYFNKITFSASSDINFAKGMILPIDTFDPQTQVTRSTYDNIGQILGLGGSVFISIPITKKWQASLNGGGEYVTLKSPINGTEQRTNIFMSRANINSSYTLHKTWRASISAGYRSGSPTTLQGRRSALVSSSIGTSKDILSGKVTLSANVANPFQKYRENTTETLTSDFSQTSINYQYYRSFSINASYKFGKLKEQIKKNRRNIRNDDLSN